MKYDDVVVGMKVVPHNKTIYGKLKDSTEWRKAKEINQSFLYVAGKPNAIMLNHRNDAYSGDYFNPEDFEPYIKGDVRMNKSDLKTGMKVVSRDGMEYIYFDNFKHNANDVSKVLLGQLNSWNSIEHYNDNLTNKRWREHDIVAIYLPNHVYAIGNFFGSNNNVENGFTLIWSEKSKQEFELENLIKKLQIQLSEAQSELNKIKSR